MPWVGPPVQPVDDPRPVAAALTAVGESQPEPEGGIAPRVSALAAQARAHAVSWGVYYRAMHRRRSRNVAGAALLAVLASAACASSGFRYVANQDEQVFFKVPDSWELYQEGDVLRPGEQLSEDELATLREEVWLRGFDASASPDPDNILDSASVEPRGYARVQVLEPAERDVVNLAALRRVGFPTDASGQPIDPLTYVQQNPDGAVVLIEYEDNLELAGGARGVRLVASIEQEGVTAIFERINVVNAATDRLYSFTVGCRAECWEENEDLISEIADSWTLEEKS